MNNWQANISSSWLEDANIEEIYQKIVDELVLSKEKLEEGFEVSILDLENAVSVICQRISQEIPNENSEKEPDIQLRRQYHGYLENLTSAFDSLKSMMIEQQQNISNKYNEIPQYHKAASAYKVADNLNHKQKEQENS